MSTVVDAAADLKEEARHHVDAVMPSVLAEEAKENHAAHAHQHTNTKMDQELMEEPEIVELPLELAVTDAASLTAEVDRLVPLLTSLHSAPWAVRVSSLKRLASLQRDPIAASQANFADQMWRLRDPLAHQLTDRRSLVVKQACESITAMSARFRETFLHADPTDAVQLARTRWTHLTTFFIDALLPLIPITVQVIHASACLCLNQLVKQLAPLYREDTCASPLLVHLLTSGLTHKHGVVRDHCFRAVANSIARLDPRYRRHEDQLDQEEIATLDAATAANVRRLADHQQDQDTPSAPGIPPASASGGSPLYRQLESSLVVGITDSSDKARAAARLALIQFSLIAPARASRIVGNMTAAQQKVFAQQKAEFEVNKLAGMSPSAASSVRSLESSPVGSANPSDEELEREVNPPSKKAAGPTKKKGGAPAVATAAAAAASAAPAASTKQGSVAAARKKALKGKKGKKGAHASEEEDGDVVSVVTAKLKGTQISAAAQEKAKEAAAAEALAKAAATKSSSDEADDDEDDEETTDDDHKAPDIALLSPTSALVATAAQQARNFTLLAKLLDLEAPMLTEKMTSFLLHPGVLDVFTAFVARVPDEAAMTSEAIEAIRTFSDFGAQYHNVYAPEESQPGAEYSDLPLVHRARPHTDDAAEQVAVRRSYHVMQILCGQRQSQSLMAVLMPKIAHIMVRLMCVFHPKSQGNFFHACSIMQKFLIVYLDIVLQSMCTPVGRVLFSLMFDHLHEPPVTPFVLGLFQAVVERKVRTRDMAKSSDVIGLFQQEGILHKKLMPRIVDAPTDSRMVSQASAEFVLQVVEKILAEQTEAAATDLSRLLTNIHQAGGLVAQLTGALAQPAQRPPWQLTNIGGVLNSILNATANATVVVQDTDVNSQALAQMMGNTVSLQKRLSNALFPMKADIYKVVGDQLTALTAELIRGETPDSASSSSSLASTASLRPLVLSSYTVPVPFTAARVQLFKLVIKLVEQDIDLVIREIDSLSARRERQPHGDYPTCTALFQRPRLFQQISHDTWRVLIQWFLRYIHNNFFLGGFRTLLQSIIELTAAASKAKEEERKFNNGASGGAGCCTDETLRFLFVDARLLDRLIAFYTSPGVVPSCACSYILDLFNYLRLSADLVTHQSFIWTYLQSSDRWQAFLPTLQEESTKQAYNLHVRPFQESSADNERAALERALGFSLGGQGASGPPANPAAFITPPGYGAGIELGSVFAWHKGFLEKGPLGTLTGAAAAVNKKKAKKAAKKKKLKAKKKAGEEQKEGDDHDEDADEETDDGSVSDCSSAGASPVKKGRSQGSPASGERTLAAISLAGDFLNEPTSPTRANNQ